MLKKIKKCKNLLEGTLLFTVSNESMNPLLLLEAEDFGRSKLILGLRKKASVEIETARDNLWDSASRGEYDCLTLSPWAAVNGQESNIAQSYQPIKKKHTSIFFTTLCP